MTEPEKPAPNVAELEAEIPRLNKIIKSLMDRAERNASIRGSEFNLFQTTIMLEDQVRNRTSELEEALQENEKINRALRESENNYRLLIDNAPISIHEIDLAGKITSMNDAGLEMYRERDGSKIIGGQFLDFVSHGDRKRVNKLLSKAFAGETNDFECESVKSLNKMFKSCFVPIRDERSVITKIMGISEDITERKKAEEKIHELAFNDPLTGLPNRRLLHDRLKQAMVSSARKKVYGAVMFLDLDNFKPLNDEYGHDAGDLLLVEVAQRIKSSVRGMDTVARIGGDEFVVMLNELDADKKLSARQAGTVADKIRSTLSQPYLLHGVVEDDAESRVEHHCTASIGVNLFIDHDNSEDDILKCADLAMYQAKEGGRDTVVFYKGS